MDKIFYVIEVNKGNGPTGVYYCEGMDDADGEHNSFMTSTCIEEAVKFFDHKSADAVYSSNSMTLKDWVVTEHMLSE